MDVREDNREEALLPKLLPLIFFNGAFAVAYAGILLREISARTYATELAYLVPGILFLFFAACSGIAGRLFLNRVSSSAGPCFRFCSPQSCCPCCCPCSP